MSNATAGPGFLLQMGDGGSPETFTTIAEVLDIKGPQQTTDVHDVTNQSSPNHHEEIIPGIIRSKDVTFDIHTIPSDATQNTGTGLKGKMDNRTKTNFKLLWPDSSLFASWAGYVVDLGPNLPVNGPAKTSVSIRPTGPITVP